MAQVVSQRPYTVESSIQLTRPEASTIYKSDTNTENTFITDYDIKRRLNQINVPQGGAPDYRITCCDSSVVSADATHSPMPSVVKKRHDDKILDPITGFVSPAGEFYLRSNRVNLASFGNSKKDPQNLVPHKTHSIRNFREAIDEIKRTHEDDADHVLRWNAPKVPDVVIRNRLGGWTSEKDLRAGAKSAVETYKLQDIFPNMKVNYPNEEQRDKWAKSFQYKTSTQEMYETVSYDKKLPPKLHAPVTTYETRADPLRQKLLENNRPQIWQTVAGSTWDRGQYRNSYFSREPVAFTAPTKKGNQIPGYSGHMGGKTAHLLENMDDVAENFEPIVVLRTEQPKEPAPNFKSNIPGYTGLTHPYKTTSVSHYDRKGRPYTTTAAFHRLMPSVAQNNPDIPSLSGDFARIQTRVAPQNPYDNIRREVDPGVNHSLDFIQHPIVINKDTTHADYSGGTASNTTRNQTPTNNIRPATAISNKDNTATTAADQY